MDIQALQALQEEDGRLRDLQRELKTLLPKRRAEAKARLQAAQDAVEAAVQENLAAEREYKRFERDLYRQRDRMARAERNAAGMTNARALAAAEKEHRDAQIAAQTAEMDAAEADAARSPTEKKLDAARAFELEEEDAVREILATLDARKEQVELELNKVKARRDELAQAVPPDQLRYYERLRLTRWPCIAAFNRAEGVCTGCNLVQPPSVKQAVSHADKDPANAPLVTCPACGRILA